MRAKLAVIAAVLTIAGGVSAIAQAEFVEQGNLLVSFDAGLKPSTLPRSTPVPVKVGFRGTFENLDASDTPALDTMLVRLSRGGQIQARGLPRCPERKMEGLTTAEALGSCRKALVGRGTVRSAFRFPDGRRGRSTAPLLLFNAPRGILMHVHTKAPLKGTFLIPMSIHKASGAFGTVLKARFPKIAAGYGFLTGFEMVINRTYTHNGQRRSFLLASCPAPSGFSKVSFELARVTYRFRNGVDVDNSAIRTCTVKG